MIDTDQRSAVGIDEHIRSRSGFRYHHIVGRIHDASTRATGFGPFGKPHQSQITIETVQIRKSRQEPMGELPDIDAHRAAAKLHDGSCQRGVPASGFSFARELAKRTIDHGESWKGSLHGWNQQVNALQESGRQDFSALLPTCKSIIAFLTFLR
jgi:hypothetical protein